MDTRKEQVQLLQMHLSSIRKIAGWTTEQFGDKIGVTKQTISNLENNKTPLSVTQYIAIRAVLDYEIQSTSDNEVLAQVVEILLNRKDEFTDEEFEKISESVGTIAATASGGVASGVLRALSVGLLGGIKAIPLVGIGGAIANSEWLARLLKEKK